MTPLDIALGNPEFRLESNPELAEFLREYSEENSFATN
jgi:hypothetical protein